MILDLDSSAMVAYLMGEPEGQSVRAIFESASADNESVKIYAHSVNLAEVYYHVLRANETLTPDEREALAQGAIKVLKEAGVRERNDMDADFWRAIARTIQAARALPTPDGGRGNLALGDAFGVALSNRLGADFVTKDRTEIEPLADAGLVSAIFIR